MSSETASADLTPADMEDGTEGVGLLMLGLAQMVCIFAFWMALWPAAFGLPRAASLGTWLGVAFGAAGALGFYLGFQALTGED